MAKVEDLVIKIKTDDGELQGGLNKAERKLNDFGNTGKKIVGIIGGAFAIERIASFTMEITKLGGELEGVRAAFGRIATTQDMKEMQEATKGTVSELNLMKRAVMAENLGLPIENLANLFEFATKRAQDTGESVDYLVESIVNGIGRKSPLILDNLGISAVQLKEKLNGVGMETASVADIAAAVGSIAAESMERSGGIIENSTIKTQQAKAAWEDLKATWGETISQSGFLNNALTVITNSIKVQSEHLTFFEKVWYRNTMQFSKGAELAASRAAELAEKQAAAAKAIDEYNQVIDEATGRTKKTEEGDKKRIKTLGDLKEELKQLKESLDSYGVGQDAEIQRTLQQIEATEKLIKSLTTLRAARTEAGAMMQTRGETPQIGASGPGGQDILGLEFDKVDAYGEAFMEKYRGMMQEIQDEVDALNAVVNMAIVDGMVSGLEALINGANFGGVMKAVLSPLAGILEAEGKILIAAGLGIEAFKKGLSSLNPAAPLLTGALLIGLAQGMKALGNIGSTGGASGGGYSAGMGGGGENGPGNFRANSSYRPLEIKLSGELTAQGSSLKYVLDQENYNDSRTRP